MRGPPFFNEMACTAHRRTAACGAADVRRNRGVENKVKIEKVEYNNKKIALVCSEEVLVQDVQSALDLIMTAQYETGAARIALAKEAVAEAFFVLSTGLAGEILQKFINYQVKVAIYGDYSGYTSKPLRDFIYESNRGKDVFFVADKEEALQRLAAV